MAALDALPAGTILDGEVVALDEACRMGFQRLTAVRQMIEAPLICYVFDLLAAKGRSLLGVPLRDPVSQLETLLNGARDPLRLSDRFEASAADFVEAATQLIEGVVVKRLASVSSLGSGRAWVKQRVRTGQ